MKATNRKGNAKKLILCDFDGTITQEDVGYNFLNKFTRENWEDIDQDYVEGEIGSKEAYARIAKIIMGTREEMVDFICHDSSLDPHFNDFYAFCKDKGVDLKIVSDGFGLYIDALLNQYGISGIEYFANKLVFKDKDRLEIDFPFHNPECGTCGNCKSTILKKFRDEYDHIIFIGNGLSDRCVAEEADEVYAKDTLYSHCIESDIPCWNYDNFSAIEKNMSKNIRGIIFDLDGTLINSVESIHKSFNYALESLGCVAIKRHEIGVLSESSIMNTMNQRVRPNEINDAMRLFKEKYTDLVVNHPSLFPDARRVISRITGSGVVLGIATNMGGEHAREVLRQTEIEGYFKAVIGANEPGKSKPNPGMIFDALRGMNLPKEDVVFVGDSVIDIETGMNAKIDVYVVPTGFETKERLSEKTPKRILNGLGDLVNIIDGGPSL